MFILDDILLFPVNGFKFIMRQIQEIADRELNDESVLKQQLLELQMRLELEEISDEDYAEAERELFGRMRAIKMRQLEALGQVHTAETSSIVIESGSDSEGGFYEPGGGDER
ncbi:MAG: gas vesicle protein GvpG [Acidobacteria bacterium]|nr:gas vesicle protein GvpG [Acidobacteriota bacterium]